MAPRGFAAPFAAGVRHEPLDHAALLRAKIVLPDMLELPLIRDLMALRTLVAIEASGSFAAAAGRLAMSRAMASKHVSDLEAELGVKLINRTTRRLSLTEAGHKLTASSRTMLEMLDQTAEDIVSSRAIPRGTLRINAPTSFGIRHLAPIVSDFLTAHPKMTVDLTLDDRVVDIVEQGYDLAIRIRRLEDSSLTARLLAPAHMILCAAPAYLARHGAPSNAGDLERHSCLVYDYLARHGIWSLEKDGRREDVRISGRMRSNNGDVLMQAAIDGHGIALVPTFMAHEAVREGRLVTVLRDWAIVEPSLYAVMPPGRVETAKVRAFLDHLAHAFGKVPAWDRDMMGKVDLG